MSTSVALTVQEQRTNILTEIAEKYTPQIAALAPRGVSPEHFIASLRLELSKLDSRGDPSKLLECSPTSIARGILRVAQTGLVLGETCYLLPFGKEAQFSVGYQGFIDLAHAAGVRKIEAKIVREGDKFEYEYGTDSRLRHVPIANNKGKITHAYAVAEIRRGSFVFEVATREEIETLRQKYSKQWKSGTLEDIPWYARKTMIRKLAPYLPKNPRLAAALQFDAEDEVLPGDEIEEGQFEIMPTEPTEGSAATNGSVADAPPSAPKNESDPFETAIERAKKVVLPGPPSAWSGQGGKLIDSFSTSHLESIQKWCVKKIETDGDNEDLQLVADAADLILKARAADQIAMELDNGKKAPKAKGKAAAAEDWSPDDEFAAGVAENEKRAQEVGL